MWLSMKAAIEVMLLECRHELVMWRGIHHVTVHSLQPTASMQLNHYRRQHASSTSPSWYPVCASAINAGFCNFTGTALGFMDSMDSWNHQQASAALNEVQLRPGECALLAATEVGGTSCSVQCNAYIAALACD